MLDDADLLQRLSSEADIALHTAHADHMPAARAILAGLKATYDRTGDPSAVIHTSGTGVLCNVENDESIDPETVYHDTSVEQMASLPASRRHRDVDFQIISADKDGYVRSYIVLPGLIYGLPTGPIADLGIQNIKSVPIVTNIRFALARGQAATIGDGQVVWPAVEVHELGDFYQILFDSYSANADVPHGVEGYYFVENGEFVMVDVAREVAVTLHGIGKGRSPEPEQLSPEEMRQLQKRSPLFAFDCRARGERSRALGWRPKKTKGDMLKAIRVETLSTVA
ncbi:hypothetical protein BC834DRAFT_877496 [Gloeopeniophorella convolvens]|nr:hypothetical protein BC834DRAFT_877496 [Gloeopeniophorella convolvens]